MLASLDLGGNPVEDRGAMALADALLYNASLTELGLRNASGALPSQ